MNICCQINEDCLLSRAIREKSLTYAVFGLGLLLSIVTTLSVSSAQESAAFTRRWVHTAETSAVIYWQMDAIAKSADSYVDYGTTAQYGQQTPKTADPRLAHLHRITGLQRNTTYHYRMVLDDGGGEIKSEDLTFATADLAGAIRIPGQVSGPPYVLNQTGALYVLTQDIAAPGTAVQITGTNITLELDGHTVSFGTSSSSQVWGISVQAEGPATVSNGHVVQGGVSGDYSAAVNSQWRAYPREYYGISTDVYAPNAYPMRAFGSGSGLHIHHNRLYSRVSEIENRHYPGNDLLRINVSEGGNVSVHDNILTDGTHKGINLSGDGPNVEVSYNDIKHHARYVNGYAIVCSVPNLHVHHNKVSSMGRGVHLTRSNIDFHDNYLDIKGHMTLDRSGSSGTWNELRVELHGIKFEGDSVTNAKVYDNYMRIIQKLPDAQWDYVPATPLNIAGYNRNAMNEVYGNTFVALTEYSQTHHGGYGSSGQWASSIHFVNMTKGAADSGKHSVYIHNNKFISNDLFVSAIYSPPNMTIRIEKNTFILAPSPPPPTENRTNYRGLDSHLIDIIANGDNVFTDTDTVPKPPTNLRVLQ